MQKLAEFIKNEEHLKLGIVDYSESEIDIISMSDEYYWKNWKIFKRPKEKNRMSKRDFLERLYNYLWIQKVSEFLIILYLEDLKCSQLTGYRMNRLLKRTSKQYSATLKIIQKLEQLGIVNTKKIIDSPRNEKQILINKKVVRIYGDDEFRQMMLDDWDSVAKDYIKSKLEHHKKEKGKIERKIMLMKKGRRG